MNEKITTTQAIKLFLQALKGQNFSPKTIRAYGDDLRQFVSWVQSVRVDFDNPRRMDRRDVEAFMPRAGNCRFRSRTAAWSLDASNESVLNNSFRLAGR